VLKPEDLIEAMKKAEGRIDDMEMWLAEKPDSIQFNMEALTGKKCHRWHWALCQPQWRILSVTCLKNSKTWQKRLTIQRRTRECLSRRPRVGKWLRGQ